MAFDFLKIAQEAAQAAGEMAGQAATAVGDVAEKAASAAADAAKVGVDAVASAAANGAAIVSDAAAEAAEAAQAAGEMAGQAATAVGDVAGKAASVAADAAKVGIGVVASAAANGAAIVSDAAAEVVREANNRWYNPLFLDEYQSTEFDRPKLIIVSDEDERKGVEACKGAIGWMRRDLKPEVMHLYEEFVPLSGLNFYPHAVCDTAYVIDPFDSSRYIDRSQFLSVSRRDQMTELKQIAHMLGAKECLLEYAEEVSTSGGVDEQVDCQVRIPASNAGGKTFSEGVGQTGQSSFGKKTEDRILFRQEFEGAVEPSMPVLKWYKDDNEILDLIETRLNTERNTTKSYRVEINSFASMCMSASQAIKIDASLGKAGVKDNFSLQMQFEKEVRKVMVFEVRF